MAIIKLSVILCNIIVDQNISRLLRAGKRISFHRSSKRYGLSNMKAPPLIIVQFVHLHGPFKGEIQEFTEEAITIGRQPSSLMCFPPDLAIVSRKHAEIIREGNRFRLVDLSANGTFVNGKRVKEAYLKNGDVLTFAEGGPKVSFLTQMKEDQAEINAPFALPPPLPVQEEPPRSLDHRSPAQPKPVIEKPAAVSVQVANMPVVFQYGPTLRSFKQVPITIGKHPNCQFVIDLPEILDMHAQVFYGQDQYWIKDLTGRGMILVNGQPLKSQTALSANDLVSMSPRGPVFRFLGEGRFAEEEEVPPEAPGDLIKESKQAPQKDSRAEKTGQEGKTGLRRFFR
jgi:pSer/pThr/pTyr-binding forkhead associated (FHA) protein